MELKGCLSLFGYATTNTNIRNKQPLHKSFLSMYLKIYIGWETRVPSELFEGKKIPWLITEARQ